MTEATARLILIMSSTGAAISLVTLFGGGYLLWRAKNEIKVVKARAEASKKAFEDFVRRLSTI